MSKLPRERLTPTTQSLARSQTGTIDSTKSLPSSSLLSLPRSRPQRGTWENPLDPSPNNSFGDSITQKANDTLRCFFQNVHGLSCSPGLDDYHYYMQSIKTLHVDIAGLAETNTCWHDTHLRSDFRQILRRHSTQSKAVFGFPTNDVDPVSASTTFQAGGNVTLASGIITSRIFGDDILDSTSLGRWSGFILRGADNILLSVISDLPGEHPDIATWKHFQQRIHLLSRARTFLSKSTEALLSPSRGSHTVSPGIWIFYNSHDGRKLSLSLGTIF